MPTITFIEHNETPHQIDAESGQSLMQVAVDNFVPGIDGDCGGACACGTCHVILSQEWSAKLAAVSTDEDGMLGLRPDRHEQSRLACQIDVTDELDGLVVHLPEFQM